MSTPTPPPSEITLPPQDEVVSVGALTGMYDEPLAHYEEELEVQLESRLTFRKVCPTDMLTVHTIEKSSYPSDEAASKSSLQYRQHHAAPYFRCAVLDEHGEFPQVIGYICSTRTTAFTAQSMSQHDSAGPILAMHSVAVQEPYRRKGIATSMLADYLKAMEAMDDGIECIQLLAKESLLGFYVKCGFQVTQLSPIRHGKDMWFDLERKLNKDNLQAQQERPCWIVDSFAREGALGSGNPAAVVYCDVDFDESKNVAWMQAVAKEFNLSETAFIWEKRIIPLMEDSAAIAGEEGDAANSDNNSTGNLSRRSLRSMHSFQKSEPLEPVEGNYNIRFYSRNGSEVELCGHATLAASAVLLSQPHILFDSKTRAEKQMTNIIFHAKLDTLKTKAAAKVESPMQINSSAGQGGQSTSSSLKVEMDFPWKVVNDITMSMDRSAILRMLNEAFGLTFEAIIYVGLVDDGSDLLVELTTQGFYDLPSEANIDFAALTKWSGYSRGLIVCCRAGAFPGGSGGAAEPMVDFYSRFFGPKMGINEDPVTGSAFCALGPYFGNKFRTTRVVGHQRSERGGIVDCILEKPVKHKDSYEEEAYEYADEHDGEEDLLETADELSNTNDTEETKNKTWRVGIVGNTVITMHGKLCM
jgi:predicted PhzF superfamily epimerase YddE/YHI9/ribosomal protein S18 acetylase RimI-like enzyme